MGLYSRNMANGQRLRHATLKGGHPLERYMCGSRTSENSDI